MIEYIHSFNKEYTDEMKLKKKENVKVFPNIDKSLTGF